MLRLILFVLVLFVMFKASTFGWHVGKTSGTMPQEENTRLAERLKQHVYRLQHEIGNRSVFKHEALTEAAKYITEQLVSFGYPVAFQSYHALGDEVQNIIASKRGRDKPEEFVILGAHYDTCYNPGADDNASSVAGLLELARWMKTQETRRSIKFIAFVNEEPPFFQTEKMGSRVYVLEAKKRKEKIHAALVLESIGYYSDKPHSQRYPPFFGPFYPNRGNFIAIVGDLPSRWLVQKVVSDFKNASQFPIESVATFGFVPGVSFSDNWSFWKEGYPAVMMTDTAFYRNPHYHSHSDTFETLHYEKTAEVVKGLGAVLVSLAN